MYFCTTQSYRRLSSSWSSAGTEATTRMSLPHEPPHGLTIQKPSGHRPRSSYSLN